MCAFVSELADVQRSMSESDPRLKRGLLAGLASEIVSASLSELVTDAELELPFWLHA